MCRLTALQLRTVNSSYRYRTPNKARAVPGTESYEGFLVERGGCFPFQFCCAAIVPVPALPVPTFDVHLIVDFSNALFASPGLPKTAPLTN